MARASLMSSLISSIIYAPTKWLRGGGSATTAERLMRVLVVEMFEMPNSQMAFSKTGQCCSTLERFTLDWSIGSDKGQGACR